MFFGLGEGRVRAKVRVSRDFLTTYFHLFHCNIFFLTAYTSKIMQNWNYEYCCFVVNVLQDC